MGQQDTPAQSDAATETENAQEPPEHPPPPPPPKGDKAAYALLAKQDNQQPIKKLIAIQAKAPTKSLGTQTFILNRVSKLAKKRRLLTDEGDDSDDDDGDDEAVEAANEGGNDDEMESDDVIPGPSRLFIQANRPNIPASTQVPPAVQKKSKITRSSKPRLRRLQPDRTNLRTRGFW